MVCWSCEKDAGKGVTCGACGAVQPPEPGIDHFRVLGVERRFDLDVDDLERRHKDMTRVLHPDRWARADARARRFSLERTVQLNDAWRTLREPARRAEYLLQLAGIDISGEEGPSKRGVDGETLRLRVAPSLLMEVMELREGLARAKAAGDTGKVRALTDDVRERRSRALQDVAARFAEPTPDLDRVASVLVSLRYYDRFLEEVGTQGPGGVPDAGVGRAD